MYVWPTLLQKAVITKSQDFYADLFIEDSANYKIVKIPILKTCELVSEAYRQNFRNHKKSNGETYIEFFLKTEPYFNRWNTSKGLEARHDKLKQLVLVEEFKRCVPDDVKRYLDERSFDDVYQKKCSGSGICADP